MELIPFNRPSLTGRELDSIAEAHAAGKLSGDGPFSKRCENRLQTMIGCDRVLLTHSCTAALEMSALLLDIAPGDEVIMPSFTFVSTANAFALRGGRPVFVDIRPDTLNIDERLIEDAITPRTRAICVVHYAGVACAMDEILAIADRHGLAVVEDAAQAIGAAYNGQPLGGLARFGALSFHETKNVTCGEGGALLLKRAEDVERAEIMREKGTDRSRFMRGMVDKYTWRAIGSSFLLGELAAAFLSAQLEAVDEFTRRRHAIWTRYHEAFAELEARKFVRRPMASDECQHNAHMYYLLIDPKFDRDAILSKLNEAGVNAVFHYVPLHSSDAGRTLGRSAGPLPVTDRTSRSIVRLPLWPGLENDQISRVVGAVYNQFSVSR